MSPAAAMTSPGITRATSSDRRVHGDELGAVGEGGLDLDLVDHLGNPLHDLLAPQDRAAIAHQLGNRPAVARTLYDVVGNQRDRLGVVELDAAFEPAPRHDRGHRHEELVLFARRQVHRYTYQTRGSRGGNPDAPRRPAR